MKYAIALLLLSANALGDLPMLPIKAYLEGEVTDSSVQPVIDAIVRADDLGNRVIVEINSPGGEIEAGFRLVKAIERAKKPVTCVVDGDADSMASYVLEACAKRAMTKRSVIMIHEVGAEMSGGHEWDLLNAAASLAASSRASAEHYAAHIPGLTADAIRERTSGGRCIWMSWQEAKKLGAVDVVVNGVNDPAVSK